MTNSTIKYVPAKKKGDFDTVYLKEVPVVYASVHEPKKKYQSDDMQYALTAFVTTEMREVLDDEVKINKEMFEVGKDKNKLKKLKFPVKDENGEPTVYADYKGLHGISLTLNAKSKKGKPMVLPVIDGTTKQALPKDVLVGNGSVCTIKLSGWRNQDGLLNASLSIVMVDELVEYQGSGGVVEDEEMGVTVNYRQLQEEAEVNRESQSDEFEYDDIADFGDEEDSDDY